MQMIVMIATKISRLMQQRSVTTIKMTTAMVAKMNWEPFKEATITKTQMEMVLGMPTSSSNLVHNPVAM